MRQFRRLSVVVGMCSALTFAASAGPAFAGAQGSTTGARAMQKGCGVEKKVVKKAKADVREAEDGSVKAYKKALKAQKAAKADLADCQGGGTTESRVRREPVNTATPRPFATAGAVGEDRPVTPVEVDQPTTVDPAAAGLYGGTLNSQECDRDQLVTFLMENPDKGEAWAEVLGITFDELESYIGTLTPVLLRSDTRVTNHSFNNGKATPIQSVLQAGTAVLVDEYGEIVTKCYCGNPLTPPDYTPPYYPPTNGTTTTSYYEEPPYYGPKWPEWTPTDITFIDPTTRVKITEFELEDVETGQRFKRPAGTDGSNDRGTSTQSTPRRQPSATTTTSPHTTTTTDPYCYEDPPGSGNVICA